MASSPEVDSLLELCTSVPEVTPSLLGQWIFSHGGPACLECGDAFSTVRNVLIEWGLEHCIAAAIDEHTRLVAEKELPNLILNLNADIKRASTVGSDISSGVGNNNVTNPCQATDTHSITSDHDVVESDTGDHCQSSTVDRPDSGSLDLRASAANFLKSKISTTSDSTLESSEEEPVTWKSYDSFDSRVLSASSEAAVSRLDAFPCPNCCRKDAAAALREVCQKAGGYSGNSGNCDRTTVVTHVGGSAGWWVQRVEMQTETTWWRQDGRLQTKRERHWHADSKWCVQGGSSTPGAASDPSGAGDSGLNVPSLELMAGEHVVEVEQFIVPANRADRTKQQPRRGIVTVAVAVVDSPFNGVLLKPAEYLDPGQEFDFDQVETGSVIVDGRVLEGILHYRRAGGNAGWVPKFDASGGSATTAVASTTKDSSSFSSSLGAEQALDPLPASEVVREVVPPVTPHPSTVLLHSAVRSHLNRPAPNLGASLHLHTSRGACFSLTGRGNRETCFEVNWRAEAAAAAPNKAAATAAVTIAENASVASETFVAATEHDSNGNDASLGPGMPTSSSGTTATGASVPLSAWLGVTVADNGRIIAVAPGSSAAHACVKPGCRLLAVLPGGRGGANFRHTVTQTSDGGEGSHSDTKRVSKSLRSMTSASTRSSSADNTNANTLPGVIPVSSAADAVDALARCAGAGCHKAAIQVAEYPFIAKVLRRLRFAAPPECGIIGLRFDQGQLAGVLSNPVRTKPSTSNGASSRDAETGQQERVCSQCRAHRARAFGDFYRDVSAASANSDRSHARAAKPPRFVVVDGVWIPPLGAVAAAAEAIRWYEIAAEAGDLSARTELNALLSRRRVRRSR